MADGFRKALFGFNCDDVIGYVKKTHKEFSEKETVLNEKIEELSSNLAVQKRQNDDLAEENSRLKAALEEYTAREDEIKHISEEIGNLYIVSQANAKAIIENAEENKRLCSEQVNKNLLSIKEAHEALSNIVKGVTDTSAEFTDKVRTLSSDLEITREKIAENDSKAAESEQNLNEIKENLQ